HERVPDLYRIAPVDPDLVAQVAGVSGAGDIYGHACDLAAGHAEILQLGDVGYANGFYQLARSRSLQCERGDFLRDVFNLDIHVQPAPAKPAQAGISRGAAIFVFFQARNGAVVNGHARRVAPAAVNRLAWLQLVDVAGDDAVHQPGCVFACHQVLVEG